MSEQVSWSWTSAAAWLVWLSLSGGGCSHDQCERVNALTCRRGAVDRPHDHREGAGICWHTRDHSGLGLSVRPGGRPLDPRSRASGLQQPLRLSCIGSLASQAARAFVVIDGVDDAYGERRIVDFGLGGGRG